MTDSEEVINKEIPNFDDFLHPSDELKKDIENMIRYAQFNNKKALDAYVRYSESDKQSFSGGLNDWFGRDFYTDLFETAKGKPWETLLRASLLLEHYDTKWDLDGIDQLGENEQWDLMNTIKNGISSQRRVESWFKKLLDPEKADIQKTWYQAFGAIQNALKHAPVGDDDRGTFKIMKVGEIDSHPYQGGIGFLDDIVEMEHPGDIAHLLKTYYSNPPDSLFLTYVRSKQYEWKASPYLFLIYKKMIYVLDGSDHRVNLLNTAGARTNNMRNMEHVWLPWDIIFGTNEHETDSLVLRNRKAFKRGSLKEVFKNSRPTWIWMSLFTYKVMELINSGTLNMETAVSVSDLPMLPDKTGSIPTENKMTWADYPSVDDIQRNDYLLNIYRNEITSLVPMEDVKSLPILGTVKYLSDVIEYNRRKAVSIELQEKLNADWESSRKEIGEWFKVFCESIDLDWFIAKALENKEYAYEYFGSRSEGFANVRYMKPSKVLGVQLVGGHWTPDWTYKTPESHFTFTTEDLTNKSEHSRRFETRHGHPTDNKRVSCYICKKNQWTNSIKTSFVDYHQFCEFFEIEPSDLPKKVLEHFNRKRDMYTGNGILNDVDPVDYDVEDPFPSVYTVAVQLCNTCERKYLGDFWARPLLPGEYEGWVTGYRFNSKQHYYVGERAICNTMPYLNDSYPYYSKEQHTGRHTPCPKCEKRLVERKENLAQIELAKNQVEYYLVHDKCGWTQTMIREYDDIERAKHEISEDLPYCPGCGHNQPPVYIKGHQVKS